MPVELLQNLPVYGDVVLDYLHCWRKYPPRYIQTDIVTLEMNISKTTFHVEHPLPQTVFGTNKTKPFIKVKIFKTQINFKEWLEINCQKRTCTLNSFFNIEVAVFHTQGYYKMAVGTITFRECGFIKSQTWLWKKIWWLCHGCKPIIQKFLNHLVLLNVGKCNWDFIFSIFIAYKMLKLV